MLLAPHVFVEDRSVASIAEAKTSFETTNLPEKLARHHRDAASTFWGWNEHLAPSRFPRLEHRERISASHITCPRSSPFRDLTISTGPSRRCRRLRNSPAALSRSVPLAGLKCRHSPQRDQPEAVLAAIAGFVKRTSGNKTTSHGV